MKLRLDKKELQPFLRSLMDHYDLYAPVELAEGVCVYKRVEKPEEVNLSSPNPLKPAKEVFFPQSEAILRYERIGKKTQIATGEEIGRERLLFGVRPCDIQAISILDQVFLGKEYTDVYYLEKRKKTTIIGLACDAPLSTCFCPSTGGGPFLREGSDLFFVDLGDAYLVDLVTEKGMTFQKNKFLKEADEKDLNLAKEIEERASKRIESSVCMDELEKKLDQMVEDPLWDRIQEKCVGCRVCTYLCPTCHCFDIMDEALNNRGQRVRNWDSCLSSLYSQETSGHNPRPTGRERTRQRLMHKFNYFPKIFNRIACVGCGRCITYCPANFDIRQTIKEIQKD